MQQTPSPFDRALSAVRTTLARRIRRGGSRAAAAALLFAAAAALAAPEAAAADACAEGSFGEGGTYTAIKSDDPTVTGMTLAFQCGEVLEDGRLVPTGYRLQLVGECDGIDCDYPVVILSPTARPEVYTAFFVEDGANVMVHVRPARRENIVRVTVATRTPGKRRGAAALDDDDTAADTAEASDTPAAGNRRRAGRRGANRPKVYRMRRKNN